MYVDKVKKNSGQICSHVGIINNRTWNIHAGLLIHGEWPRHYPQPVWYCCMYIVINYRTPHIIGWLHSTNGSNNGSCFWSSDEQWTLGFSLLLKENMIKTKTLINCIKCKWTFWGKLAELFKNFQFERYQTSGQTLSFQNIVKAILSQSEIEIVKRVLESLWSQGSEPWWVVFDRKPTEVPVRMETSKWCPVAKTVQALLKRTQI